MVQLFHKKSTAILTVAAILVLVLLLCALLTTLSQMTALHARVEKLQKLVANAQNSNEDKQALLDFIATDEYVVKWAEDQGLIKKSDISYIDTPNSQGK